VVNPDLANAKLTEIAIPGARIDHATGSVLSARDVHEHNTFDRPDNVRTEKLEATVSERLVRVGLPAASVSRIDIEVK
jgi:alpha-L-arabinofuranosidase